MAKRSKFPLIPKGPTPAPGPPPRPPESEAEVAAKKALRAEQDARARRCMDELQAVLTKHRCIISARTIIFYDGRSPMLEWDLTAQ